VGVARALAADPPVLLMDEPFGAVDPIVRARLQRELLDLQARVDKTIVLVTHDIDEAIALGDRIAVLNVGGVLEQYDTPDALLANPANDFVAQFLGAERSIKRLALARVRDLDLSIGPWVDRDSDLAEAKSVLDRDGGGWIGLIGDGLFLGWVSAADVERAGSVDEFMPESPAARVSPDSTLREALELILTSHSSAAVVEEDDGRFCGVVQLETIRRGLAS
jgi:osmoprotectant transport system ATP-binding protein